MIKFVRFLVISVANLFISLVNVVHKEWCEYLVLKIFVFMFFLNCFLSLFPFYFYGDFESGPFVSFFVLVSVIEIIMCGVFVYIDVTFPNIFTTKNYENVKLKKFRWKE